MTQPNPAPPADGYKWRALAAVGVGNFMAPLMGSIVNIALPDITSYFKVGLPTAEWVVMAFLLVISSLLLTYGRLGDMLGHKPVYVTGFAVFTVGSALCGFATSIEMLIAFRILQGIGAGMVMAIGPAIITAAFPPRERGKALGIMGMVVAAALAAGPALGGLLVGYFGWRAVFLLTVPIGLFGTLWAAYILAWKREPSRQTFDFLGAGLFSAGLTLLLLVLSKGQEWGWDSFRSLVFLAAAGAALALFIRAELKVLQPMLDLSLFRNRLFSAANASALLNFMAQFSVFFLFPFYLLDVRHLPAQQAGLLMMVGPLVVVFLAPVSGTLSDRIGSRLLSSTGMALITVSLFLLSRIGLTTPLPTVALSLGVLGLGVGLFQSPNNSAIMGSVPRHRLGIASGMLATMRNVGMVMGIAVAGAVFAARHAAHLAALEKSGLAGETLSARSFTYAMHDAFLVGAFLALLGVVTSLVRGDDRSSSVSGPPSESGHSGERPGAAAPIRPGCDKNLAERQRI